MKFSKTFIDGVYIIDLNLIVDDRGGFARTYCHKEFEKIDFCQQFVQMNHSYNLKKGTVRGLHFQYPPFQETKLIRCINGVVNDVIVDIRKGSPTFLKHLSVELSSDNKKMVLIPVGCAHGFQTMSNNTELIYHHTAFYDPKSNGGLLYNDPCLMIDWNLPISKISSKDMSHPLIDSKFLGI